MKSLNDDREANNCNPTHLFVLHQFTQERRILQIGGALLPDLVEFYQWIHTELSHLVTYQKAEQISIGTIIKNSARRHSQEYSEHLTELFKRVKRKGDLYVQHVSGNKPSSCIHRHVFLYTCKIRLTITYCCIFR